MSTRNIHVNTVSYTIFVAGKKKNILKLANNNPDIQSCTTEIDNQ